MLAEWYAVGDQVTASIEEILYSFTIAWMHDNGVSITAHLQEVYAVENESNDR